jgi:two-component system response regulator FlrC
MSTASVPDSAETLNDEVKQREWSVIQTTIAAMNGSRKKAAEKLGISQRTLRYKLAKMREAGVTVPERSTETL